jgi:hypothetical protein
MRDGDSTGSKEMRTLHQRGVMRNSGKPASDGGRYNSKTGPPRKVVPTREIRPGRERGENVGAPTFKVILEAYSVWLTEYPAGNTRCGKKSS